MELGKRAKQFQTLLESRGFPFKVQELPASTRTAQDAANALGCKIDQIVKSLVFRTAVSSKPLLVLACGSNRVNAPSPRKNPPA